MYSNLGAFCGNGNIQKPKVKQLGSKYWIDSILLHKSLR